MSKSERVIVDPIHGDIRLTPTECELIDTATFQRLRRIKQLSMAHYTYPNATHTRFAHSLGVLQIMKKVIEVSKKQLDLSTEEEENLRLAALLHDVGHYPYSHLMEQVDKVLLSEDEFQTGNQKEIDVSHVPYPDHEELGQTILSKQDDIQEIIGGEERTKEICALFRRSKIKNLQSSKLIHSSLDMDRLDYLIRDSQATGVPYGMVDINYLLNNLQTSPTGMLGVLHKALPAAEQFLMARYFMHRTVYFHKTTVGLEEACRQLLRRIRNRYQADPSKSRESREYGLPANGDEVNELVGDYRLQDFDDSFVDRIIHKAQEDDDQIIRELAIALVRRRPPRLLKEVSVLAPDREPHHAGSMFKSNCKHQLSSIAKRYAIPLGFFLFHSTPKLGIEKRAGVIRPSESESVTREEFDELIKVYVDGEEEPQSIVEIEHSLLSKISEYKFQYHRLYVLRDNGLDETTNERLLQDVSSWASAS